jgi:transcriptional regulator with XRE-family HTH domain
MPEKSSDEKDPLAITIGARLRDIRQSRCLSNKECAKAIGIHHMVLYQWERGHNLKNVTKFFELCKKLGVTPDYFFQKD